MAESTRETTPAAVVDTSDGTDTIAVAAPSMAPPSSSVLSDAPSLEDDSETSFKRTAGTSEGQGESPVLHDRASGQALEPIAKENINGAADQTAMDSKSAQQAAASGSAPRDPLVPSLSAMTAAKPISRSTNGAQAISEASGERTPTERRTTVAPDSATRGRGKVGRPRGSGAGRGKAGSSRKGKRKRGHDDDDDDGANGHGDDTSSSEEFIAVSMTKSGRAVQKPTTFVPAPLPTASPSTNNVSGATGGGGSNSTAPKRKKVYRRNPEAAVCKVCLRGTSPTNNMIVFCDGCNAAYHRYCHRPPIDQSVVDEVDKEWYCGPCEKGREEPVPEAEVESFVAAGTASVEQRQRYFASLAPGMLVTLLTRATTLQPDLPLFAPDFVPRSTSDAAAGGGTGSNGTSAGPSTTNSNPPTTNGHTPSATTPRRAPSSTVSKKFAIPERVPDDHPPTYPLPGQGLMQNVPQRGEQAKWIVDDGDRYGVFTHMYQVDSRVASEGLNGGGGGGPGGGGDTGAVRRKSGSVGQEVAR